MSPLALSLRFLQSQPDSRLVELARDGHAAAFEAIVGRYRKELLAYCRRLQPRWGNAEDSLQQTLLQAWKALKSGAEVREVRPWLYRIAHNVVVSDLRTAFAEPQELEATAGGPEVDQLVEQRLRARAALDAMASLPTLQRQALVSTTFDGASRAEVAAALGLSRGAVRGLVYRARETLRAAAAAITPSPALSWVLRRGEVRTGSTRATVEALAGGGGAGVVGLMVKGSAVIAVAGAVAGTGSVLLPDHVHRHAPARAAAPHDAAGLYTPVGARVVATGSFIAAGPPDRSADPRAASAATRDERGAGPSVNSGSRTAAGSGNKKDHEVLSSGGDGGASSGGRSSGGSDGGVSSATGFATSSGGSTGAGQGSSDGNGGSGGSGGSGPSGTSSGSGNSVSSGSGTDRSNSGLNGGSDGASSGGSTSASSGSAATGSGGQMMSTVASPSDGGSGSGGGISRTSGDSGSGDLAATTGTL